MVLKAFWPWIPCLHRARSILEPASVLCRGLSAAFRVICNILSRVSVWIYFRLVRVYLGDQRMRRVKDQDEEGKGPGDQEDPGTRGPRDQGTRGAEDHGTRRPKDQRTRGPGVQRIRETWICFSNKFIFVVQSLRFFVPGNLVFFPVSSPLLPHYCWFIPLQSCWWLGRRVNVRFFWWKSAAFPRIFLHLRHVLWRGGVGANNVPWK